MHRLTDLDHCRSRWALPLLSFAALSCGRTQSFYGDGGVRPGDGRMPDYARPMDGPWWPPDQQRPADYRPPRDFRPRDGGPPRRDHRPPPVPDARPWPDYAIPRDTRPWPDYTTPRDTHVWPDYAVPDAAPRDFAVPDAWWPEAGWPDYAVPDASWPDGSPQRPDLMIAGFKAAAVGHEVRYEVLVCNRGDAASPGFYLDLYYDRPAAPQPLEYGDDYADHTTLAVGECVADSFVRPQTPPGKYLSWVQLDADQLVDERDEQNNAAGPQPVVVGGPPPPPPPPLDGGPPPAGADLVVAKFSAYEAAGTLIFDALVCNQGSATAGGSRVDFYANQVNPPPEVPGDAMNMIPALAPQDCVVASATYPSGGSGTYFSWARVDVGNLVFEDDESNNLAGPQVVVVGPPLPDCAALCAFAVQCGVFPPQALLQCGTWCIGLTTAQLQCLGSAMQQGSCAAFQACPTPPPPPPPPPPGLCPDLCTFLVDDCNLLPSNQYWTCIGVCQLQPPDKLACAEKARVQGQCMGAVNCLF